MEKLRWLTGRGLELGRFDFLSNENILLTHYQLIKMNPKVIRIYLIIMGIIGIIMFAGLFLRSHKSSQKWIDMEITGQINDFVHIGKNVFIQLDTVWYSFSYNRFFDNFYPSECKLNKEKGTDHYYILCPDSETQVWSGSGGIVEDKIWLRRIEIALNKKKKNH
jgi:hypothetical protein